MDSTPSAESCFTKPGQIIKEPAASRTRPLIVDPFRNLMYAAERGTKVAGVCEVEIEKDRAGLAAHATRSTSAKGPRSVVINASSLLLLAGTKEHWITMVVGRSEATERGKRPGNPGFGLGIAAMTPRSKKLVGGVSNLGRRRSSGAPGSAPIVRVIERRFPLKKVPRHRSHSHRWCLWPRWAHRSTGRRTRSRSFFLYMR